MDSTQLNELLQTRDAVPITHNGYAVWVEEVKGDTAKIKYLNSGHYAQVPISELVDASPSKLPDLDDNYPVDMITRQSPIIRA